MKSRVKNGYVILRVSSEKQAETQGGSLDAQRARANRFLESKNDYGQGKYEVIKFIEEEQSAFGIKNKKRVEFQLVLTLMKDGKVDFIIFESISRLTRDMVVARTIYDLAIKNNVEIWEVESNTNYSDPSNANLFFMFMQKALWSEIESHQTSNRVATKHREARVNSGKDTSTVPVLGLDAHPKLVGKFISNEAELVVVRDIMKAFVRFGSFGETLRYCEEKGYRTKERWTKERADRHGNRVLPNKIGGDSFNTNTLKSMLINPKYKGDSKFKDTKNQFPKLQDEDGFVPWKYAHGQVIDDELLNEVAETIKTAGFKKRPRLNSKNEFALLTGIVKSQAGSFYQTHSAKAGKYAYYVNPVNGHRLNMELLDKSITKLLKTYNDQSSAIDEVVQRYFMMTQSDLDSVSKKALAVVTQIELLSNDRDKISFRLKDIAVNNGDKRILEILSTEYQKIDKEYQNKINEKINLSVTEELIIQSCVPDKIRSNILKAVSRMDTATGMEKKLLLKSIISEIVVTKDGKVVVVLNPFPFGSLLGSTGGRKFTESSKWWDQ